MFTFLYYTFLPSGIEILKVAASSKKIIRTCSMFIRHSRECSLQKKGTKFISPRFIFSFYGTKTEGDLYMKLIIFIHLDVPSRQNSYSKIESFKRAKVIYRYFSITEVSHYPGLYFNALSFSLPQIW